MHYEIKNVEPFNDIFYRSCFFNSFFPVVNHRKESLIPYLTYDASFYQIKQDNQEIYLDSELVFTREVHFANCAANHGVNMMLQPELTAPIEQLKEFLGNDNLVVLWIDAYHSSHRKDTFGKLHWPHTILLYGFDEEQSVFYVIDHYRRENLTYTKMQVPFDEIETCYNSYLTEFLESEHEPATCFTFGMEEKKEDAVTIEEEIERYLQSLAERKRSFRQSLDALRMFCSYVQENINDIIEKPVLLEKIMKGLTNIILNKGVEVYRYSLIFPEQKELIKLEKDIEHDWIVVRSLLVKGIFRNNWKKESLDSVVDMLKLIMESEYQAYRVLFRII